ncbi:hypothetical protein [Actinoplanes derwentensis]|uniref:hypothetical protein n=1 Tax=Actinoplanes derwentensis TaxID=113562 RepID=UPI0012FD558E|nr:hypothetical protein [Actinoplanes derwentensis]
MASPPSDLASRLVSALTVRCTAEIARRGGETGIESGEKASALRTLPLRLVDREAGLVVLHVEGWRYYSRAYGSRRASLSYLCGHDDAGDWAVRLPGTVTTVTAALTWLTPAAVTKALAAGKQIDRQGDIYAIATSRAHDAPTGWLGDDWRKDPDGRRVTSHHWDATNRLLTHHPDDGRTHRALRLDHPVRFLQQRAYAHGRSGVWGTGD